MNQLINYIKRRTRPSAGKRSDNIMSSFTKTKNKLQDIVNELTEDNLSIIEQKKELDYQFDLNSSVQIHNRRVIQNIDKFLGK